MGASISWLAVKQRKVNELLEKFKLIDTGETEEGPESDISGADFINGWCHFQFNDFDSPLMSNESLSQVSKETMAIGCFIEEHVMYSKSVCWMNGEFVWEIEHFSEKGIYHLACKGTLPENFETIKNKQIALQKQEEKGEDLVDHIFDVPLLVAKDFTWYKHDEFPDEDMKCNYRILQSTVMPKKSSKKAWWKFW